jgi:ATP-dependent DNA helicase DinG
MQEARAHASLKQLLRQDGGARWPHHLTLSRLVARSLQRGDHSLVRIQPGSDPSWLLGLLVPAVLSPRPTALVVSDPLRRRLLQRELPKLATAGLTTPCWEGTGVPAGDGIWLLDHREWLEAAAGGSLGRRQLLIPEGEQLADALRGAMGLTLANHDWEQLRRAAPGIRDGLLTIHERLSRRVLAAPAGPGRDLVALTAEADHPLLELLERAGPLPRVWERWRRAARAGWASWARLDTTLLQWQWQRQPLEPLRDHPELLSGRGVVITALCGQQTLPGLPAGERSETSGPGFRPSLAVLLGDPPLQEALPVFLPRRQPLPNGPAYPQHLLEGCRRLILGRSGLTVILLDDATLRRQLLSSLAADFGSRVVHERTAPESNGVLCCRWSWWIAHHDRLPPPEQIVVGLLPLASLEDPLVMARVRACKQTGDDWFRSLLLPESIDRLQRATAPLRRCGGRLAILDGRVRGRSWGRQVLEGLEPWELLQRLLPD